jgi:hypothetical protein
MRAVAYTVLALTAALTYVGIYRPEWAAWVELPVAAVFAAGSLIYLLPPINRKGLLLFAGKHWLAISLSALIVGSVVACFAGHGAWISAGLIGLRAGLIAVGVIYIKNPSAAHRWIAKVIQRELSDIT